MQKQMDHPGTTDVSGNGERLVSSRHVILSMTAGNTQGDWVHIADNFNHFGFY